MEWQGVNLTNYREKSWLSITYRHFLIMLFIAFISTGVSIGFWLTSGNIQQQINQNQQELNKLAESIARREEEIKQLKDNQKERVEANYLTKKAISEFIQYLTQFSVKGSIDISQLYFDQATKVRINGKLTKQSDLEKITTQLSENNLNYKLENLQTNEQNQFEFSLIIQLQEQDNEKLDQQKPNNAE